MKCDNCGITILQFEAMRTRERKLCMFCEVLENPVDVMGDSGMNTELIKKEKGAEK